MATGIVKGEKVGEDALTADVFAEEPFPLPSADDQVSLSYPNKVSERQLLVPTDHEFLRITQTGTSKKLPQIQPNAFVLADNFFALQSLLSTHAGRVNLFYLDPPFATGMEFHSRQLQHAYQDRFGTATYLEIMRRRLILMRELLSPDGSIYLHIGHQMLFHLKVIMDEVFGRTNFRNLIVRKKCSSKNYTRNQYANLHDYILFYTKTKSYKWNQPGFPASEDWIQREYPKIDSKGRYKLVPVHAPGIRKGETGKKWRGMLPPPGKHWQFIPSKLDELDRNGEIHWSRNDNPRRKVYLPEGKNLPLTDYWECFRDAHHQSILITGYPTEKNLEMLKAIVAASSDEGDFVIDPFAGSGTTLQAARDLNRSWIGIDESMTAANTTIKRMRHGISPMGDYVKKKTGPSLELFGQEALPFVAGSRGGATQMRTDFSFVVDANLYRQHKREVNDVARL